jgi:hypothetical protein
VSQVDQEPGQELVLELALEQGPELGLLRAGDSSLAGHASWVASSSHSSQNKNGEFSTMGNGQKFVQDQPGIHLKKDKDKLAGGDNGVTNVNSIEIE